MILLLLACTGPKVIDSAVSCDACAGACVLESVAESTRDHVADPIDYPDAPPTNGNHNPCWAAWGEHAEEVPDENWVHNLEHGGVVFLYQCPDGCEAEVEELLAYTSTLPPGRWIVSPYSQMEWQFAAVAWSHRVLLGCFDLPTLSAFYDTHVGHGPEDTLSDPAKSCM